MLYNNKKGGNMSMTNFDKEKFKAFAQSVDLSNLMVVVPTIRKFAERYKYR